MKGEFQKRIEEYCEKWAKDFNIEIPAVIKANFHLMVDEAQKEFDEIFNDIGNVPFETTINRLDDWGEKWFGDENK